MLRSRIIPCLLIHKGGLVKTVNFKNPKYVGDPINAVRIFNEKEVDELIVIDIDSTAQSKEPNYELISDLAGECRMPLCYGGGVKTPEQVEKIVSLGVEKVALSSSALLNPEIISESAKRVGNQSLVIVLDIKKVGLFKKKYQMFTHNGKNQIEGDICQTVQEVQEMGAGEIVINNIDREGTLDGYDLEIVDKIYNTINIPLTVIGGASGENDFQELINRYKVIGVSAGSIFVLTGKYRAVLIQYLTKEQKNKILGIN